MNLYKITLTDNQVKTDHSVILQNLITKVVQNGTIKPEDVGIYSDLLHRDLTYGDYRVLFLNPKTYQAIKDNLSIYSGEFCDQPDYQNLSSLFVR